MRKYIYYSGIFITLLLTLNSCEKEMMNYEGEDALYFDVRSSLGAHEFFTAVPFGSIIENDVEFECDDFRLSEKLRQGVQRNR